MSAGTHTEAEDHAWAVAIPSHPGRTDSPGYVRARKLMIKLVKTCQPFYLGDAPYDDHHGAGLWIKDAQGWLLVRNLAGIEWSAQFCADPAKVDALRRIAERLVAAFPLTEPGYLELGYPAGDVALLHTPITDAAGVAAWTDSIFNASVPLPKLLHTGVLPKGGGFHHYPAPIAEIVTFKHDDFDLFVTLPDGSHVAVVPVAPPGSGDGRVQLVYAPHHTALGDTLAAHHAEDKAVILPADHPLARAAFAGQPGA